MNQHILVVDDEAPTRELLSIYFKRRGCTVTTTSNGTEALLLIKEPSIQVVILDINLGSTSGLDLLAPMKQVRPSVPIILFSGVTIDNETLAGARQRGAAGYLSKTQPLDQMWAEVQRVLQGA